MNKYITPQRQTALRYFYLQNMLKVIHKFDKITFKAYLMPLIKDFKADSPLVCQTIKNER